MLATLKNKKNEIIYSLVNTCGKTNKGTPSTKKRKRNRGVQQRDNHPTQGYKSIKNYIKMTCIINMVEKQYN